MNRIFAGVEVGRKNIGFGIVLFLVLGVVAGIPLTVDLFGGSMMSDAQYQAWKVLHAYGVFLAFVNFFFGYGIDRLNLTRQQKEIASWSFLAAGLFGGFGRSIVLLSPGLGAFVSYAISLIETLGFVIGTFLFVLGQMKEQPGRLPEPTAPAHYSPAK
jgi:hypothetical protein